MADLKKTFAPKPKEHDIQMQQYLLGSMICKFTMPKHMIVGINNAYDKAKDLPAHNDQLAGKIANEFKVTDILTDDDKSAFRMCFQQYLHSIQKPFWHIDLENAWINDMKAGEYNPFHWHTSTMTDLGMSSVLVLKRPKTYGKEFSREDTPANGRLEFNGGQQDPLSISQLRVDAQVGDLFIFPYTMLHGVYPFNGTDEVRRTLAANCDVHFDPIKNRGAI